MVMSLWSTYLPNGDKFIEIVSEFVDKAGKCGDKGSKFSGNGSDFNYQGTKNIVKWPIKR